MKKVLLSALLLTGISQLRAQFIEQVNFIGALDKDPKKDWTLNWTNWNPQNTNYAAVTDSTTLNNSSGELAISNTLTLDASKVYLLKSVVVVKSGGKLVIPAGTLIRARSNASTTPKEYATIVVERGGQIESGSVVQLIANT